MLDSVIDGKYTVLRQLGHGGMGTVYECSHLLTGRRVALKVLRRDRLASDDENALRRFRREARAAGLIDSQHAVQVLDVGFDGATQQPYISMELLEGADLRRLIAAAGKLRPQLVARIGAQICLGLARAHARGVIHRDIKPANIFLAQRDAQQLQVKILDFGIAKLLADPWAAEDGQKLTGSGALLGSPLYMSPEQAIGSRDLDRRSDIWSLGVVLYEALCGSTPHSEESIGALVLRICSETAQPLRARAPWVDDALASIVDRALALERSQRHQTAEDMYDALCAQADGAGSIHEAMVPISLQAARAVPARTRPISYAESDVALAPTASAPTRARPVLARSRVDRRRTLTVAILLLAAVSLGILQLTTTASAPEPARVTMSEVSTQRAPEPPVSERVEMPAPTEPAPVLAPAPETPPAKITQPEQRPHDSEEHRQLARVHFERGIEHFDRGAWQDALVEFLRSRELHETKANTKNAAICLRRVGRHVEALAMFERLSGFPTLTPAERAQLEREIAELE